MRIGFEAKRAFHNTTGLGHYSRTLISSLAETFREHEYILFNPRHTSIFDFNKLPHVREHNPTRILHKVFSSAWRSKWVTSELKKMKLDLYHGLSHEIPVGINDTNIPTVVTMHDLIHERYPEQYKKLDVKIYSHKFRHACTYADTVIAISQQTKNDLVQFYQVPEEKIRVCYQSCNPAFMQQVTLSEKERVRKLYNLPAEFILYVGSVIERKNLLNICKALSLVRKEVKLPLVVIGEGNNYLQMVKDYVKQHDLNDRLIFLSEQPSTKDLDGFRKAIDFPAIYQQAKMLVYPSFFEGFGIPVLEALNSGLPVITSGTSCLPEAGGDAALYVNPSSPTEIAEAMLRIINDDALALQMREAGFLHARNFTPEKCAASVMDVYLETIKNKQA